MAVSGLDLVVHMFSHNDWDRHKDIMKNIYESSVKAAKTFGMEGNLVAGANIVSKHTKARRQGETSSIVKTEGAMYASKVQLVCTNTKCAKHNKGIRARVQMNGDKKVRVCPKCGAEL